MPEKHLAEEMPTWLHPADNPPPHGTKLLILSPYGIAHTGDWYTGAALWMPLPKVPNELKERARQEGLLK